MAGGCGLWEEYCNLSMVEFWWNSKNKVVLRIVGVATVESYVCYSQYQILLFLVVSVPHRMKTSQVAILLVGDVTVLPPCLPAMPTPIAEGAAPPVTLAASMQTRDRLSNTPILSHSPTRDVTQEFKSSTTSAITWDSSCACQGMVGLLSEAWHWAWHTSCSPARVPSSPSPKTLPSKRHHPHLMKVVKYVLWDHNLCGIYLEWAAGSTNSLRCGLPPQERSRSLGNFQ